MQKFLAVLAIAGLIASCGPEARSPVTAAPVAQTPIASPMSSPVQIAAAPSGDRVQAQVISVGDGDTIRAIIANGQEITVRLACIDAPETNQPLGPEATEALRFMLPRDQAIALRISDIDRYGRTVAEIYRGESLINLTMVREGAAVIYSQYLNGCASNRDEYLKAESAAREEKLGFWKDNKGVMPWDWRRGQRTASTRSPEPQEIPVQQPSPEPSPEPLIETEAPPQADSSCDPSYPGVCIPSAPPDLDCGDISERRFTVTGSDPHGFDRDGDGIGCES